MSSDGSVSYAHSGCTGTVAYAHSGCSGIVGHTPGPTDDLPEPPPVPSRRPVHRFNTQATFAGTPRNFSQRWKAGSPTVRPPFIPNILPPGGTIDPLNFPDPKLVDSLGGKFANNK